MLHQRFSRFSQLGGPGRHTSEFSAERSGPAIGPLGRNGIFQALGCFAVIGQRESGLIFLIPFHFSI